LRPRAKVAKKFALYPPKRIVEKLHLKEGQTITYEVVGRHLVMKAVEDPFELAIKSKKWAKTSLAQFEAESVRDQERGHVSVQRG
jgi:antitoxin component of MazEF toxin-antitoxin module